MAAYAALVSLMQIIDQIQLHPHPPISLNKKQVVSLTRNITFLQEFLEGYSHVDYSEEADALEMRIADAAYAAEDIIESHMVHQVLSGSASHGDDIGYFNCFQGPHEATSSYGKKMRNLYQGLRKVIKDLDLIKRKVKKIKQKKRVQHLPHKSSTPDSSITSSVQNIMVGFDNVFLEVMDKLIGGYPDRLIIPIVGMGGIGKTTLARNIYQNQNVVRHFDILVWVTISQEYRLREILLELLQEDGGNLTQMNEYELGDKLHKRLSQRRYLIIMDDIWDTEVWDQLKFFFPDNKNESRIILTTRLSNLASYVADSRGRIDMAFLDEENSWNLFSKTVFGEKGCPLEILKEIGKNIVDNCKGLPLSIVVIGGLLAKKHTQEYWEYIAENLNSVLMNSEDDESCLKILSLSYNQLPIHLKPCFLYMGVLSEDSVIRVSTIVELWVAEGFLKPISGKSLEVVAQEYLMELIDRNLIFVHELGSTGSVKYCNIHDLIRDLCLGEAQKERFYNVIRPPSLNVAQDINTQRRIVIPKSTSEEKVLDALRYTSLGRSVICNVIGVLPWISFRLLRILKTWDKGSPQHGNMYFLENMFQLVNSRYLAIRVHWNSKFASSVCLLSNLQTLIVSNYMGNAPAEIWNMPQLRHVKFIGGVYIPEPPRGYVGGQEDIVLKNLQTLMTIINFKFGEDVIKRIPHIKKLGICYDEVQGKSHYCLKSLDCLHKLASFHCNCSPRTGQSGTYFLQNLTFPQSLKKLTLKANYHVHWEHILGKIDSLPHLEKLKLQGGLFKGREWETVEGQFCSLKFLLINDCLGLEYWVTESSHFPRLKHLVLRNLPLLKVLPSEIGEIPTLQSIELDFCSDSAVTSAKTILDEQRGLENEGLQVRVILYMYWQNEELEELASPNFQVECRY